ncbi:unnamed protein product [Prorocentrum cordatum]|uniref:Uncharacterized protein n=1 Tax=Prorocentrum cordatum TaxID=2364126 RepID=A0ABN9W4F6_9DINO|nr:unnamed protein product [Polarella glacialis]
MAPRLEKGNGLIERAGSRYGPSLPSLLPMPPGLQVHGDRDGRIVPVRWGSPALPHELQLMSYGYLRPLEAETSGDPWVYPWRFPETSA